MYTDDQDTTQKMVDFINRISYGVTFNNIWTKDVYIQMDLDNFCKGPYKLSASISEYKTDFKLLLSTFEGELELPSKFTMIAEYEKSKYEITTDEWVYLVISSEEKHIAFYPWT